MNEIRSKSVSDVFKASPSSVFEFFAKAGQGLYVPAYQRPYSWDRSNISRLIEDAAHGFRMLVAQPDTVTFLGTIIAIHDTQHRTVSPVVLGQVPSRVMTIIDGQQRLTTLLIINTVLHEYFRLAGRKLKAEAEPTEWLQQEVQRQLAELSKTFEEDQQYGHGPYRYYPRMIRSFVDQWSTDKKAIYKSPLAWYLHTYGQHVRDTANGPKKFVITMPSGIDSQAVNAHEAFQERVKAVTKAIHSFIDSTFAEDDNHEVAPWSEIIKSRQFQQTLLNQSELPEAVVGLLEKDEGDFHKCLRALLFSRFLLARVGLTIVEATNEDSAFDLFEALNTTGEPLTAYETFKPKVIQQERLEQFLESKSHQYLEVVDDYLSQFKKTDDKQEATRNLVVSFALAETGDKLSRHLSEQRRYLRDRYEALEQEADKLKFVRHLSHCAALYEAAWPTMAEARPKLGEFDAMVSDKARICIDYLRNSNHSITIGPLTRYYSAAVIAKDSGDVPAQRQAIREFEEAILAIAAFWTLWRASRPGTESVDSHYRSLMQIATSSTSETARQWHIGLARVPAIDAVPNSEQLKQALRAILVELGGVSSKEVWVGKVNAQTATRAKAVTRFLLLCALHDSPADLATPGLNEKGVGNSVNLLTFETWRSLSTIEHIAPEKPEGIDSWSSSLYAIREPVIINTVGNLTLLPHSINASISNRTWRSKRYLYQVLSSPSEAGMKELLKQGDEFGVTQPTQQLLEAKSTYMAQIDALARVPGDWDASMVDARGKRLAELAWDKLSAWLGWSA